MQDIWLDMVKAFVTAFTSCVIAYILITIYTSVIKYIELKKMKKKEKILKNLIKKHFSVIIRNVTKKEDE